MKQRREGEDRKRRNKRRDGNEYENMLEKK